MYKDSQLYIHCIEESYQDNTILLNPSVRYPEYPFSELESEHNYIYESIRDIFYKSGYDKENYNTSQWNPLGQFILPGQNVLIKPNMVLEFSHKKDESYISVVSHPSIIRCMVDYVYIALQGKGTITIADSPINSANFDILCQNMRLNSIRDLYEREKNFTISIIDFRLITINKDKDGIITDRKKILRKEDFLEIEVDRNSSLVDIEQYFSRFRVTDYDNSVMPKVHNQSKHRYCFHKSVLNADVILSIPKIKTHRKAGFTCALKNWVGLNGNKDYLPHHTKFSVSEGGDEYLHKSYRKKIVSFIWDIRWREKNIFVQRILKFLEFLILSTNKLKPFKDRFSEGSWYGNRTISRTTIDLNKAVLYADKQGRLQENIQRKILYLVDGVVCGEGEGPMEATSKRCNLLIFGHNALVIDTVVCKLMGFNPLKVDTLNVGKQLVKYKLYNSSEKDINIFSNMFTGFVAPEQLNKYFNFQFMPSKGWKNFVELSD